MQIVARAKAKMIRAGSQFPGVLGGPTKKHTQKEPLEACTPLQRQMCRSPSSCLVNTLRKNKTQRDEKK